MLHLTVSLWRKLKTVVFQPIGEDDVTSSDDHIVTCSLIYDAAVNLYVGSLALHKHQWSCLAVKYHDVGTLGSGVDVDGILLGDAQSWHVAVQDEKLHYVTTYPLLGCQHDITSAYGVEDHRLTISLCGGEFYRWEV